VDVLSSRILVRPGDLDRSLRFYRDVLGLAVYREFGHADHPEPWGLVEMWIEDPDGIRIVLVQVPADHSLRRDPRSA
jgi:glyoxalase/bleomycin resistance protein/dioxygenase superfamily protein